MAIRGSVDSGLTAARLPLAADSWIAGHSRQPLGLERFGRFAERLPWQGRFPTHLEAEVSVRNLEVVVRRNSAEVREVIGKRLADSRLVAAAVGALGDDPRNVDLSADRVGVLAKAQRGRRDAFHPCFGVDDEDHGRKRLGDHRGARAVAVVQPHDALDDADVALAAVVVPPQTALATEPQVERSRGTSRDRLVVARVDEVRSRFRRLDLVTGVGQRLGDRERRDGFPTPELTPRGRTLHRRRLETRPAAPFGPINSPFSPPRPPLGSSFISQLPVTHHRRT